MNTQKNGILPCISDCITQEKCSVFVQKRIFWIHMLDEGGWGAGKILQVLFRQKGTKWVVFLLRVCKGSSALWEWKISSILFKFFLYVQCTYNKCGVVYTNTA